MSLYDMQIGLNIIYVACPFLLRKSDGSDFTTGVRVFNAHPAQTQTQTHAQAHSCL